MLEALGPEWCAPMAPMRSRAEDSNASSETCVVDRLGMCHAAKLLVHAEMQELALDCIHVWDALSHLPRSQRYALYSECKWHNVCTAANIATSHKHVLEAGFFAPLSTIKRPITHIISKAINIRCQARKFPTVVLKNIKSSSAQSLELRTRLNEILALSLLGNYPHLSAECRLSSWPRQAVVRHLRSAKGGDWLAASLKGCYFLLINALRELLVHSVRNDPSLEKHLHKLMHLDSFQLIVTEHMSRVRQYFQHMLALPSSCLSISFHNPNGPEMKRVCADLNVLLLGSHVRILKASFRRPNQNEFQFPPTLQKKQPLVPLANYDASQVEQTRLREEFNKTRRQQMNLIQSLVPGLQAHNDDANEEEHTSDDLEHIFQYVTPEQYQALRDVVLRQRPLECGVMFRVIPLFEHFGVERRACRFAAQQMENYRDNSTSVEQLKLRFKQLRQYHPHCYNLVQITCSIIRETHKHWLLYTLPLTLTKAQIHACATRLKITAALMQHEPAHRTRLLESTLNFVLCRVCGIMYSYLHEYGAVYKKTYRFFLRDACMEFCTGQIFCTKSKANHKGRCADQPLEQIPLLGRILVWGQRLIMLCPQPGCGNPMTVDNELCDFSEHGPCCKPCTDKRIAQPEGFAALRLAYAPTKHEPKMSCAMCKKQLEKPAESVCVAKLLSLCSICARPHVLRTLHDKHARGEPIDTETLLSAVSDNAAAHYKANKAWRDERISKSHVASKLARNRR